MPIFILSGQAFFFFNGFHIKTKLTWKHWEDKKQNITNEMGVETYNSEPEKG